MASAGNFVFPSSHQTKTAAKSKKTRTPQSTVVCGNSPGTSAADSDCAQLTQKLVVWLGGAAIPM
jgi:hypothetical protein